MFNLSESSTLHIKQKREVAEIFGFEVKNQYQIIDQDEVEIGRVAELAPHIGHFFLRQIFGYWRRFELIFFDEHSNKLLTAIHPFCFIFHQLQVNDHTGKPIGFIKQRFHLFYKKFDIVGLNNRKLFSVKNPWFKIWTFHIERMRRKEATITKNWAGLVNEFFFNKDNFIIEYHNNELAPREKNLILAASIFIDVVYFERKAN